MLRRSDRHTPHDQIRELTRHGWHLETTTQRRGLEIHIHRHRTGVPSLIWQLQHAEPSTTGEPRTNNGYRSRPAARIETLDVLLHIDHEAANWVRRLGHDDPGHTTRCVRLVGSLLPNTDQCGPRRRNPKPDDCCPTHDIERDINRWWTSARIATGWDSPAWRPDVHCPACETRGSLRVKILDQLGYCTQCRETWTPETIGLLAEHIRWQNDHPGQITIARTIRDLTPEQIVNLLIPNTDDTREAHDA